MVTAATRGACDDTADRPGRPPGRKAALESATDASIIQDAVARIWADRLRVSRKTQRTQENTNVRTRDRGGAGAVSV